MKFRDVFLIIALVVSAVPFGTTASANESKEKEKILKLEDTPAPARQAIVKGCQKCTHHESGARA
jgi:hypothetical protein